MGDVIYMLEYDFIYLVKDKVPRSSTFFEYQEIFLSNLRINTTLGIAKINTKSFPKKMWEDKNV